jgi:hypothetical protein
MPGATSFSSSPRMRGSYPGTATPVFLLQTPGVTGEPGRLADRRWAMRAARFDVRPAATPDGIAMITVMLHREDIGRLAYQVCGTCRKALICKESTGQEYQGPGLGRRACSRPWPRPRIMSGPPRRNTTSPSGSGSG